LRRLGDGAQFNCTLAILAALDARLFPLSGAWLPLGIIHAQEMAAMREFH
jgi:hypothetical protein